jgi:hypothetical protein
MSFFWNNSTCLLKSFSSFRTSVATFHGIVGVQNLSFNQPPFISKGHHSFVSSHSILRSDQRIFALNWWFLVSIEVICILYHSAHGFSYGGSSLSLIEK